DAPLRATHLFDSGDRAGNALAFGSRSDLLGVRRRLGQSPMVVLPFRSERALRTNEQILGRVVSNNGDFDSDRVTGRSQSFRIKSLFRRDHVYEVIELSQRHVLRWCKNTLV